MDTLLAALAAYLLGSVSFAVVVSRVMGLPDPRSYGSKNPGATNVLRSGSKAAALVTLFGDAAKGWLAVWAAQRLLGPEIAGIGIAAAAIAVVLKYDLTGRNISGPPPRPLQPYRVVIQGDEVFVAKES